MTTRGTLAVALARDRVPAVDAIKVTGVFLLLAGHWGRNQPEENLKGLEPLAGQGVALLLVLAGFIATIKLVSDLESGHFDGLGNWVRRKALKTYPTLIAVVLALTAVQQIKNGIPVPSARYLGYALLAGNYYEALAVFDPVRHNIGHLWTVMVGAHFLVPWAWLVVRLHSSGRTHLLAPIAAATFVISSLIRQIYIAAQIETFPAYWYLATEGRLADIAIGALGAAVVLQPSASSMKRVLDPSAGGVALIALGLSYQFEAAMLLPIRLALMSYLVVWLVARGGQGHWSILDSKLVSGVAAISYSVFAWHLYSLLGGRLVESAPWLVRKFVAVGSALFVGGAAWLVLEFPMRRGPLPRLLDRS